MNRLIVAMVALGVLGLPGWGQTKQTARPQRRAAATTTMELLNMRVPEVRFEAVPLEPRSETDRFVLELNVREGA